jgi:hypothetical protein
MAKSRDFARNEPTDQSVITSTDWPLLRSRAVSPKPGRGSSSGASGEQWKCQIF